jgi:hypothetical protein
MGGSNWGAKENYNCHAKIIVAKIIYCNRQSVNYYGIQ